MANRTFHDFQSRQISVSEGFDNSLKIYIYPEKNKSFSSERSSRNLTHRIYEKTSPPIVVQSRDNPFSFTIKHHITKASQHIENQSILTVPSRPSKQPVDLVALAREQGRHLADVLTEAVSELAKNRTIEETKEILISAGILDEDGYYSEKYFSEETVAKDRASLSPRK